MRGSAAFGAVQPRRLGCAAGMRFEHVRLAAVGHALPERRVTSAELEERLAPLYERFKLRVGRLELMSGIRERRFWEPGTRPSEAAVLAGKAALRQARAEGFEPERIGCLVHASVCRDFLEPATATVVHQALGLAPECAVFDVSNACLGVLNGMVLVANMIELGQVEAGLVVAGEDGRPLVEETIKSLLADERVGRNDLKRAFASLTIGSGGAAVLLARTGTGKSSRRLLGGALLTATEHNELCRGGQAEDASGPLMSTDAEALLEAGNALAERTFELFRRELDWSLEALDRVVTHQVGSAHRRRLLETLALPEGSDFPTVAELGNIGSVSLPLSLSLAVEAGFVRPGQRVALLGIGSGLSCLMLGLEW